ncbi:Lrp/AsnC ligand binding domain-containing protein [Jannaschia donghaensis]|uniref:AsnC family protein n=1 Tax=Jannaschia donghaensis TaxID=420998 RepID=A0A0M6YGJ5_9RHOB|nr:Lrp/AsnC ligand binding domain-containing protein [Jannaschia donghaensis]CTQ49471.1 AsnC family protein [Jannaschia donghaensis]
MVLTERPVANSAGHHALLFLTIETRPCAPVLRALRAVEHVGTVWSLSGAIDAVAEVRVDDPADLSVLTDRIAALDGIGMVTSQIVLQQKG